jgi:type I restriction-modification system DNA methylase subunit
MAVDFNQIKELVDRFDELEANGEFSKYTEAETKTKFIEPLFEALGWNIRGIRKSNDKITLEESVSKGRVDYGYWLNGVQKFYLEAKSLKETDILFGKGYDRQAINYSWLSSCSWAILTNFRQLAVYNADKPEGEHFFTIHAHDFSGKDKDKLELLSKESFEKNRLNDKAQEWGKSLVKVPVDKQLLSDLIEFRVLLSRDIIKNNPGKIKNEEELDEAVQKILDRLIFIRNAEDRELEPNELQKNFRQWAEQGRGNLLIKIKEVYKKYDTIYNSKLFEDGPYENLAISNETLGDVIEGLYSREGSYAYDFSVIASDTLGSIYEQYLGYILKKTPKRAKFSESKTHRKEQGIYYTPSYIVDYIVKKTVGEYIKTHTPDEVRKVKILDPACGSGSFLLRAYQELENYWAEKEGIETARLDVEGKDHFYSRKVEILKNNIFGVDLDSKAVEIAQLNLLLKISETKQRLPILRTNIKVGNSLIDDHSVTEKAFSWEDEFPEIMKSGGFDIIIGNPPYVRSILLKEDPLTWEYYKSHYKIAFKEFDIYLCFLERGYELLANDGRLGYIMPNKWLHAGMGEKARELFSKNRSVQSIVNFGSFQVFGSATNYTMLIFLDRSGQSKIDIQNYVGPLENKAMDQSFNDKKIWQRAYLEYKDIGTEPWHLISGRAQSILSNFSDLQEFKKYFTLAKGTGTDADSVFFVKKVEEGKNYFRVYSRKMKREYEIEKTFVKPSLKGKDIESYGILSEDQLLIFPYNGKKLISQSTIRDQSPKLWKYIVDCREGLEAREKGRFKGEGFYCFGRPQNHDFLPLKKILVPAVANHAEAAWDSIGFHVIDSVYFVKKNKETNLADEYILAILNSDLLTYFLLKTSTNLRGGYFTMKSAYVHRFPLKASFNTENEKSNYAKIIEFVKRIISLRDNHKTETELEKIVDLKNKINGLIYALYGLSPKEVTQIEREIESR